MKKTFYNAWIRFNTKTFTGTWILGWSLYMWFLYLNSQHHLWAWIIWGVVMVNILWSCSLRPNKWFKEEAKKLPENQ